MKPILQHSITVLSPLQPLISKLFGSLKEGIRDLFFPSFCLECEKLLVDEKLFCTSCLSLFEFKEEEELPFNLETAVGPNKKVQDFESESLAMGVDHSLKVKATPIASDYGSVDCAFLPDPAAVSRFDKCPLAGSPLRNLVTVFEKEGPPLSLASHLTKDRMYLAKGIAAYMAAFWLGKNETLPDLIVPLPMPWIKKRGIGFNPHEAVAEEFAKIMGIKVSKSLKSSLKHVENRAWFEPVLKDPHAIQDKSLLIIALDKAHKEPIIEAAEALQEACPTSIYAMTFI